MVMFTISFSCNGRIFGKNNKGNHHNSTLHDRTFCTGILDGLPVPVKNCVNVRGYVTSVGTSFLPKIRLPVKVDSIIAARLRAAGWISDFSVSC